MTSSPGPLDVSVVVGTYERATRLERLLAALRAQTLVTSSFEVIVVDDGSSDRTADVLARESERGELALRVIRHERNAGRASARDDGWRAARAPIVAFVDDDCVPAPEWLESGIAAAAAHPGAIVQGRTEPDPEELHRLGPFSRTIRVEAFDPAFQTCNIFYPRELIERVDGFDVASFGRVHGGEDSDLGWRAIGTGAAAVYSDRPVVRHAVHRLGPVGKLRLCAGWSFLAYARHPGLRKAHFTAGIFWKPTHLWLARAGLGLLLPRRAWPLRLLLALTYARSLYARGKLEGGGPLLAPYYALCDLAEVSAAIRNGVRYRTPML
jgi:glycosyltransferase involved in cell wall biosynthesis